METHSSLVILLMAKAFWLSFWLTLITTVYVTQLDLLPIHAAQAATTLPKICSTC